jgi:hypothetical protein
MFDQMLLLSLGRPIFFGPSAECAPYFSNMGYPCPNGFNIADWLLDVTTPTPGSGAGGGGKQVLPIHRLLKLKEATEEVCQSASELAATRGISAATVLEMADYYQSSR